MKKWLLVSVSENDIKDKKIIVAEINKQNTLSTDEAVAYLCEQ
jgi:hypothetical protein